MALNCPPAFEIKGEGSECNTVMGKPLTLTIMRAPFRNWPPLPILRGSMVMWGLRRMVPVFAPEISA